MKRSRRRLAQERGEVFKPRRLSDTIDRLADWEEALARAVLAQPELPEPTKPDGSDNWEGLQAYASAVMRVKDELPWQLSRYCRDTGACPFVVGANYLEARRHRYSEERAIAVGIRGLRRWTDANRVEWQVWLDAGAPKEYGPGEQPKRSPEG